MCRNTKFRKARDTGMHCIPCGVVPFSQRCAKNRPKFRAHAEAVSLLSIDDSGTKAKTFVYKRTAR